MLRWLRRNGLKLALALSTGLNLLVLGAVIGVLLNRDDAGRGFPALSGPGMFGYVAMLPHDARDALRTDLRNGLSRRGAETGASDWRERVRRNQERLAAEIASPDVSAEALRAAFNDIDTERKKAGTALEEALITRILALSPEERAAYAERVLRGTSRGHDGPRHGPPSR